jgi:hypothetical protein
MNQRMCNSTVKTALCYKLKYQALCESIKTLDAEREKIRARLIKIRFEEKNILAQKDEVFMALTKALEELE